MIYEYDEILIWFIFNDKFAFSLWSKGSLYLPDESTPVIEPTPISDDMNDY